MSFLPKEWPKWKCHLCGEELEALGPTMLALFASSHMTTKHSDPEAGQKALRDASTARQQGFHFHGPAPEPAAQPCALVPFDEAFYDGARLTLFDRGFFRTMKVGWDGTKALTDGR